MFASASVRLRECAEELSRLTPQSFQKAERLVDWFQCAVFAHMFDVQLPDVASPNSEHVVAAEAAADDAAAENDGPDDTADKTADDTNGETVADDTTVTVKRRTNDRDASIHEYDTVKLLVGRQRFWVASGTVLPSAEHPDLQKGHVRVAITAVHIRDGDDNLTAGSTVIWRIKRLMVIDPEDLESSSSATSEFTVYSEDELDDMNLDRLFDETAAPADRRYPARRRAERKMLDLLSE